jgi:hypothetical protein
MRHNTLFLTMIKDSNGVELTSFACVIPLTDILYGMFKTDGETFIVLKHGIEVNERNQFIVAEDKTEILAQVPAGIFVTPNVTHTYNRGQLVALSPAKEWAITTDDLAFINAVPGDATKTYVGIRTGKGKEVLVVKSSNTLTELNTELDSYTVESQGEPGEQGEPGLDGRGALIDADEILEGGIADAAGVQDLGDIVLPADTLEYQDQFKTIYSFTGDAAQTKTLIISLEDAIGDGVLLQISGLVSSHLSIEHTRINLAPGYSLNHFSIIDNGATPYVIDSFQSFDTRVSTVENTYHVRAERTAGAGANALIFEGFSCVKN